MRHSRLPLCAFVLATILGVSAVVAEDQSDERNEGADWLTRGFEEKDSKPLIRFLEAWRKRHCAVTDIQLMKKPQVEREAYAAFRAFFAPAKESMRRHVVVQKEVKVTLVDDDLSDIFARAGKFESTVGGLSTPTDRLQQLPVISRITLQDFRPSVSLEEGKVLYLSRDHLRQLLKFLVVEPQSQYHAVPLVDRYWDVQHGVHPWDTEVDSDLAARKEKAARKRKLDYLNLQLNIIPGHWGNGWHFETHPFAYNLFLNVERTRAVITFREGYGGGEAYLKKTGKGEWSVVLWDDNWVE